MGEENLYILYYFEGQQKNIRNKKRKKERRKETKKERKKQRKKERRKETKKQKKKENITSALMCSAISQVNRTAASLVFSTAASNSPKVFVVVFFL